MRRCRYRHRFAGTHESTPCWGKIKAKIRLQYASAASSHRRTVRSQRQCLFSKTLPRHCTRSIKSNRLDKRICAVRRNELHFFCCCCPHTSPYIALHFKTTPLDGHAIDENVPFHGRSVSVRLHIFGFEISLGCDYIATNETINFKHFLAKVHGEWRQKKHKCELCSLALIVFVVFRTHCTVLRWKTRFSFGCSNSFCANFTSLQNGRRER